MQNDITTFIVLSALFYFASLVERQFTNIKFTQTEKPTFKKLIMGYLLFVALSVWLYVLIKANSGIISD